MPVVVVESPAKAKTINKYLGSDYTVLASYGHVRDLPPKDGSVDPDRGFDMKWEIGADSKKHVKAIADALKKDNELILATDPDREGEAISWHVREFLENKKALNKKTIQRVVFNEITKTAVLAAMKNPRDINNELVDAYKARMVMVVKRSMGVGYAGLDNDLFYMDKTMMVFGDAKKVVENVVKNL